MTARTDVHSPLNLVTEDYEYLWSFDSQAPGFLVNVDMEWWHSITNFAPEMEDRSTLQCHHCGARLRYVALLRHLPTGYAIAVGETCLENRFEQATADFHRMRKAAELDRKAHRIVTAANECLSRIEDAEIVKALQKNADLSDFVGLDSYAVCTIGDISRKLWTYGDISERQASFVGRLIQQGKDREVRQAEMDAEVKVPAPEGRVSFEGVVVSRRWKDSDFGGSFKLTVKMTTPAGVWLAWVSEPSKSECERGDIVSMTATLTRSDNAHFAFGKRPSKFVVVGHTELGEETPDALAG